MKLISIGMGLMMMLGLAGCSAGVAVGSASYSAGPQGETYCGQSYTGQVGVPDSPNNGLHKHKGCFTTPPDDEDD